MGPKYIVDPSGKYETHKACILFTISHDLVFSGQRLPGSLCRWIGGLACHPALLYRRIDSTVFTQQPSSADPCTDSMLACVRVHGACMFFKALGSSDARKHRERLGQIIAEWKALHGSSVSGFAPYGSGCVYGSRCRQVISNWDYCLVYFN